MPCLLTESLCILSFFLSFFFCLPECAFFLFRSRWLAALVWHTFHHKVHLANYFTQFRTLVGSDQLPTTLYIWVNKVKPSADEVHHFCDRLVQCCRHGDQVLQKLRRCRRLPIHNVSHGFHKESNGVENISATYMPPPLPAKGKRGKIRPLLRPQNHSIQSILII